MGTSYYRLKPPITHLKLETDGMNNRLYVFVNGGYVGKLVLNEQDTCQVLNCFALRESDNKCPLHSYWGGAEQGAVVCENEKLPDATIVISEYGKLLTVAQVKARYGAKRKDGLLAELLDFEEE